MLKIGMSWEEYYMDGLGHVRVGRLNDLLLILYQTRKEIVSSCLQGQ